MTPQQRRPPAPFPLTIVTGFLGAGKTSLLNRLLADPALAATLVIINEFGETGLDHLLVARLDGGMLVMTSGCLCCTIRGDLIATLEDALRRRDNARMTPFERVVIETTGFADPAPVLHAVMAHPYVSLRFRLDGVITVVDAVNGEASLDAQEEAVKQAAMADRLVLSKTDLLPSGDGALRRLRARLASLNPGAAQLDAAKGEATAAALLGAGIYDPDQKTPDVRRWLNAEAFAAGKSGHGHHHGTDVHDSGPEHRDVNRHDASICAFCLRHEAPLPPSALELFLDALCKLHGAKLLRVKGIVALADDPLRPAVIHGVQHLFHLQVRLPAWPDEDRTTRIVFILRGMEPAMIQGLWRAACLSRSPPALSDHESRTAAAEPRGNHLL